MADDRTRPLVVGVVVRILVGAAVAGVVDAAEVTVQAKQLQGVVVGDQGRPRSPVVVITDSALMVAVVHPVVHSAKRVVAVVHSANESEDNSLFQGTPPPKSAYGSCPG